MDILTITITEALNKVQLLQNKFRLWKNLTALYQ